MAIGNYRVSLKIVSFFRGVTMDMFSLQGTFNACIHNVTCCIRQNSILYRSMDLRDQSSEVNNSSRYPRKHEIISLSLSLSLHRYRQELQKRCKWMGIHEPETTSDATSAQTEKIKTDE